MPSDCLHRALGEGRHRPPAGQAQQDGLCLHLGVPWGGAARHTLVPGGSGPAGWRDGHGGDGGDVDQLEVVRARESINSPTGPGRTGDYRRARIEDFNLEPWRATVQSSDRFI